MATAATTQAPKAAATITAVPTRGVASTGKKPTATGISRASSS
ncbi:hypothetical protein PF005_g25930 [Phytophthora fragariae]|uniref:Uncharacterized protein n=1 Tax=Phytophthora fragariae TaxID=53985 RepID=A0A6A3R5N8_9STRA|nr:hypothetical protein PF003_g40243 [Phytophthora fragariae]KAE8923208.1 hypothetical protein PF009_g26541 [Phytophthora fragariae]KAE9071074.1 hypothetical protein PF010_g26019 [Phytophthora fragariae]KAE9073314.1 hypothetical protein PF007_g25850 [Phytophthora fragariae]KAE9089639.1 hypothetical protein PF006_g25316 [Phytophthora fragariae]